MMPLASGSTRYQAAGGIDPNLIRFIKPELYPRGIGAGPQNQIIFEAALVARVHNIDPRIHVREPDSAIRPHTNTPVLRGTNQVVGPGRSRLEANGNRVGVRARELQP